MSAGWAIEPIATIFALGVGKTLLAFAFWAFAVHFAVFDILFEDQPAPGAHLGVPPVVWRFAIGGRTNKNGLAVFTPVLAFGFLFANGAFFHMTPSINGNRRNGTDPQQYVKGLLAEPRRAATLQPVQRLPADFREIVLVKRFDKLENSYILSLLFFLSTGAGYPLREGAML